LPPPGNSDGQIGRLRRRLAWIITDESASVRQGRRGPSLISQNATRANHHAPFSFGR
jgi:hypothetical protein